MDAANEIIGKAIDVKDAIDYRKGSVVSRTIIDKEHATVTLFAFDKGQGLSEHTAPFDAIVYITDGAAEVIIDGNPNSVGRGEFIIMPAGKPHSLKAQGRFKMMLIMIREE